MHPFLKERLVLKGGTALNLFFFDLPRLFVDMDNEDEQEVIGIHEAIISRELFGKVQTILAKILEKNASRVEGQLSG